jgi:hypothetical protein
VWYYFSFMFNCLMLFFPVQMWGGARVTQAHAVRAPGRVQQTLCSWCVAFSWGSLRARQCCLWFFQVAL